MWYEDQIFTMDVHLEFIHLNDFPLADDCPSEHVEAVIGLN